MLCEKTTDEKTKYLFMICLRAFAFLGILNIIGEFRRKIKSKSLRDQKFKNLQNLSADVVFIF